MYYINVDMVFITSSEGFHKDKLRFVFEEVVYAIGRFIRRLWTYLLG